MYRIGKKPITGNGSPAAFSHSAAPSVRRLGEAHNPSPYVCPAETRRLGNNHTVVVRFKTGIGLLCAAAGRIGASLGGHQLIERKIHGAKSGETALDERQADHCRENEPMGTYVVA